MLEGWTRAAAFITPRIDAWTSARGPACTVYRNEAPVRERRAKAASPTPRIDARRPACFLALPGFWREAAHV